MNRRHWLLGGVAAAAGAAGVGVAWRQGPGVDAGPPVGDALWSLTLAAPGGGQVALDRFRGRPLLINFWATWCAPCVKELPDLDRFQRAQSAKGWQVLGIAVDREAAVLDFLRKLPLGFPVALAGLPGAGLMRDLGNVQGVLPYSVVIDAAGRVRQRHAGETQPALLDRWVATLGA
ncbi:TlpA family protein disulfide reductase [Aquabacterium sp. J223]|uniref:TlpA family protein disulfide reductase n=1 Tax=Aquabacterium sp. J223 TaxID=2898431 RepID=UPI0021ADBEB2|nr:TlpA disulfide reductase family protein [Aquabacterium sp. J223]UUX95719.1 TlpA family protein disulfide reductase [Aquabacterium sp. J223]